MEQSYVNFRWVMQYIDFSLLLVDTLQYKGRTLAASFLYLTLLLRLELFTVEEVSTKFRGSSSLITEGTPFNQFYS